MDSNSFSNRDMNGEESEGKEKEQKGANVIQVSKLRKRRETTRG